MTNDLVRRLREVQEYRYDVQGHKYGPLRFSPEAVARALEGMRRAEGCDVYPLAPDCDDCWSSMLNAFLTALAEPEQEE